MIIHCLFFLKHKLVMKCISMKILVYCLPVMHSSRNSRVRWLSFLASVLLMAIMKSVLFAGMHKPSDSHKRPSNFS